MTNETMTLEEFQETVFGPDEDVDLARAALLIARIESPGLRLEPTLDRLDMLAMQVAVRSRPSETMLTRVRTLLEVTLREPGIQGARDDYQDPRNSFLNEVIERKVGLPIALGVLLMGVGARAGIALGGVSLPMHFVVRVLGVRPPLFIDGYDGGRLLTEEACRRLVATLGRGHITFHGAMLDVISNAAILTRMLNNLRLVYQQQGRPDRLLAALNRLLILNPGDTAMTRDRGLLHYELGQTDAARRDLSNYLDQPVAPPDEQAIRDLLRRMV
jgi:regulator of sirC expression with transglutaminase-like and TPR domain